MMARLLPALALALTLTHPGALAAQDGAAPPDGPPAASQGGIARATLDGGGNLHLTGPGAGTDAAPGKPEAIVAGLSHDAVSITASFNGSEIMIFGAVKRSGPSPGDGLGVIVTLQGPQRSVKIRKKERRLGVWINTESLRVGAAPEFYAVATTAPLSRMLSPEDDTTFRISLPLALRAYAGEIAVEDARPFTEAMVRLRERADQYRLDEGTVTLIDDTLFRADIRMPANLVEGDYKARIFLVRDGRVIDSQSAALDVRKVGLERWLYRLALHQPFWYGLLSLALAALAGWAASARFQAIRRK